MALNKLAQMPKKTNSFRCISLFCNKGGNGKTTSAIMFGTILAAKGYKVLLIDNDGQANLSDFNGAPLIPQPGVVRTENLYWDINTNSPKMEDKINITALVSAIQESPIGYGYIESSKLLDKVIPQISNENAKFTMWRITQAIKNSFDFCIIDSPCKDDILSINGIIAADDIIVTVATEADTEKTLANNLELFNDFKRVYGVNVNIDRVIPVKIKTLTHLNYSIPTIKEFAKSGYHSQISGKYIKHSSDIEECMMAREERLECMRSKRASEAITQYVEVVEEYLLDHKMESDSYPKTITVKGMDGESKSKTVYELKDIYREVMYVIKGFLNKENITSKLGIETLPNKDEANRYRIVIYMTDGDGKTFSNKAARKMINKYFEYNGIVMTCIISTKDESYFNTSKK